MKTHISIIAVALILAIASSSAHAVTTKYWDTGTGNWNVSGNWNPSSIPNSSNEVKIRYTNANCTIPNGYTASCYRLYVYHSSTATLNW